MRLVAIITASFAALLVTAATVGLIVWSRYRPPSAVRQLVCKPTPNQDGVSVTWQASPDAAFYRVDRRTGQDGTWIPIPVADGDGPVVIDRSVRPLDDVTYRVIAVSTTGTHSDAVESASFRIPIPTPTGLRATRTEGELRVSWDPIEGATECVVRVQTSFTEPPAEQRVPPRDSATFDVDPYAQIASISLTLVFPSGTSEPYDVPCDLVSQRVVAPDPIPEDEIRVTGCPPELCLELTLPAGVGCEVEYEGLDDQLKKEIWSPDKGTKLRLPLPSQQTRTFKAKVTPFRSDAQGNVHGKSTELVRPYISQFTATPSEQSLSIELQQAPPSNWQVCVSVSRTGQGGGTEALEVRCKADRTIEIPMTDLDRFRQAEEVAIDVSAWLSPVEASDSSCPQPTSPRTMQVRLPPRPTASNAEPSRGPDFATVAQTFFGLMPGQVQGDIDTLPPANRATADAQFKTLISNILEESRVDPMKLSKTKQEATEALERVSLKIVEFLGPHAAHQESPQCQNARRLLDAPELLRDALDRYANLRRGEGTTAPEILCKALKPIQEWLTKFDVSLGCTDAQQDSALLEAIGKWKNACNDYYAHILARPPDPKESANAQMSDQERKDRKKLFEDWNSQRQTKAHAAEAGCRTVLCQLLAFTPAGMSSPLRQVLTEIYRGEGLPSENSCFGRLPHIRYAAKRAVYRNQLEALFPPCAEPPRPGGSTQ